MPKEPRAFLIYECQSGWCIEPAKVSTVREKPAVTNAFSKLSQLTWWLGKHVAEGESAEK